MADLVDVAHAQEREAGRRLQRAHFLAGIVGSEEEHLVVNDRESALDATVNARRRLGLDAAVGGLILLPAGLEPRRTCVAEGGSSNLVAAALGHDVHDAARCL